MSFVIKRNHEEKTEQRAKRELLQEWKSNKQVVDMVSKRELEREKYLNKGRSSSSEQDKHKWPEIHKWFEKPDKIKEIMRSSYGVGSIYLNIKS